ncbi:MAG: glycosyltransferase [Bacteroidales bacterium]
MDTIEILNISTYVDDITLNFINSKTTEGFSPSVAAIKYAKLIRMGLMDNNDVSVKNLYLPIIAPFPYSSIKFFGPKKVENGRYIPFLNVMIVKQICTSAFIFLYALIWIIRKIRQRKIIILSSIQLPFLLGVFLLKIFNVKIVSFVPDMPHYQFSYSVEKHSLKKLLIPFYIWFTSRMFFCIDFFVFITKYQKSFFPRKPSVIVEGFVDKNTWSHSSHSVLSDTFNIMYAGGLYEKYGLKMLIDAFLCINDSKCRLWLFGVGDMTEYIKLCSQKDPRIIFYGNCTNNEVLAYEKKASLLVNPRFSNHDFTYYSFPSKLMEYMASGTPVLTTKLAGIPSDYNDKMFFFDEETIEGFRGKIEFCIQLDDNTRRSFGKSAQRYVFENKNNITQLDYILQNIMKLYSHS